MQQYQFVIMFNDYPEAVLPIGATIAQAHVRADEIRSAYIFRNPTVRRETIRVTPLTVRIDNP